MTEGAPIRTADSISSTHGISLQTIYNS